MEVENDFLLRIRELMADSCLTQNAFAKKCDIDHRNFSSYLTGKRKIGKATLNKLMSSFDVNKTWLLTGTGEKYLPKDAAGNQTIDSLLRIISEKDRQISEKDAQIKRLFDLLEKK